MEQYNNFYFVLGRENKISQKEVESVLAGFGFGISEANIPRSSESEVGFISILADDILEIKLNALADKIAELINILGGTIKIYKKIAPKETKLADLLKTENPRKKIIFAVSNYSNSGADGFKLALEAKKTLRTPARVIAGNDGSKLSSAQSFQYKMDEKNTEFGLFNSGWGELIAVQDIDFWSKIDYGKPRSDARSGMTPPKLARAMINIAIGQVRYKKQDTNSKQIRNSKLEIRHCDDIVVADPFCGSGNILSQALVLGCDIVGADISEKAVEDTKANLSWLTEELKNLRTEEQFNNLAIQQSSNSVFQADATKYDYGKIDRDFIIVSEPYLGQPRKSKLSFEEEKQAIEDITKLYINFLKNLLATGNRLLVACLVFPLYELKNGKKLSIFEHCLDKIKKIGYTLICPPLIYGRDYQIVKREIVLLKAKQFTEEPKNLSTSLKAGRKTEEQYGILFVL